MIAAAVLGCHRQGHMGPGPAGASACSAIGGQDGGDYAPYILSRALIGDHLEPNASAPIVGEILLRP